MCVCTKSLQLCWLFVTPETLAHQAPLSMGILQAKTLKWVAMPSSRVSSQPRDGTWISCNSCTALRFFYHWASREAQIPHLRRDIELKSTNRKNPGWIPGSERSAGKGLGYPLKYSWASLVVQLVKNPPSMQEIWVRSLGWEDTLEKRKAIHSSILA